MTRWKVVVLNEGGSGEVIAIACAWPDSPVTLATVNDQYTAAEIVHDHNRAEAFEAMWGALELFKRAFPYEHEFVEGSVQWKAIVATKAALALATHTEEPHA